MGQDATSPSKNCLLISFSILESISTCMDAVAHSFYFENVFRFSALWCPISFAIAYMLSINLLFTVFHSLFYGLMCASEMFGLGC